MSVSDVHVACLQVRRDGPHRVVVGDRRQHMALAIGFDVVQRAAGDRRHLQHAVFLAIEAIHGADLRRRRPQEVETIGLRARQRVFVRFDDSGVPRLQSYCSEDMLPDVGTALPRELLAVCVHSGEPLARQDAIARPRSDIGGGAGVAAVGVGVGRRLLAIFDTHDVVGAAVVQPALLFA